MMKFISNLTKAARHCPYRDQEEDFACDMVINSVWDAKCTEKLMELSDNELTLNNVIRICKLNLPTPHRESG